MLELKNVNVSVKDGNGDNVDILKDINLTLENNKIYVVTGPNGGGKTSLAKAIIGIYPVTGGSVTLDGEELSDKSITQRAEMGVGYAFQAPTRFKGLKVREFLTIAAGTDDEALLFALLVDVGLCAQDYIDREMNSGFSGGELKRIEIASILARKLKVAVFDEPEAGIDLWSFQKLTETFRRLNETNDTTIVIISHQERILRLADEVIVIAGGTVSEITNPDKILGEIELEDPDCKLCPKCSERSLLSGVNEEYGVRV
ncbi:MAG: ATP-binding cassette domain-containing protein [Oscillospiraceae bacterium]|nr:ATP-binding cassette domain-containing protein [Oscillospiraceae bacterium]